MQVPQAYIYTTYAFDQTHKNYARAIGWVLADYSRVAEISSTQGGITIMLTSYSFRNFLTISPIILFLFLYTPYNSHNNAYLVTVAKWFDCSIRVFERSIRVYRPLRGIFSS